MFGDMKPEDVPTREAVTERLNQALKASSIGTRAELHRRLAPLNVPGLLNYNPIAVLFRGESETNPIALAVLARVLGVSLEWLIWGTPTAPPEFYEWAQGSRGRTVDPAVLSLMERLPHEALTPSENLYDHIAIAFQHNLRPEQALRTAQLTDDLLR